jgi:hypothetical protein
MTTMAIPTATGRAFTSRDKGRFVRLVARGVSKPAAAEKVGFRWATVRKHLKEDPAFAEMVADAEDELVDKVAAVPVQKALDGNLAAAIFVLTNKRPHEWRDAKVIRQEHSGPGGGPIQIVQATVIALKEVLTDESTRAAALDLVDAIDVAGRPALTVGEDGDAAALSGRVGGRAGADAAGAKAPSVPE